MSFSSPPRGGLEKDLKKRRELSPESLTESSTRATSTTAPSKRNKHEANEPKSVQWEPEISGESGSVGSSNHELRYSTSSCTKILMWS
jgi:hypothetical protein